MYWDEIGVYGPGILYMLDHGISLLPAGLDPELSRGHPLFFYFLFALWVKVVGFSLVKLHLLALAISLSLFASVFYMARKLGAEVSALFMTFWLMVQGAIFAQASLALPEMLLSLEILWALYFFYQKKYLPYVLAASLALLTKESALVLPLACITWQFWLFIRKKEHKIARAILFASIPFLTYFAFLLIQKQTHGWYFFPYHMELVNLEFTKIWKKLLDYLAWLLWDQGRFIASLAGMVFLGIIFYKKASSQLPDLSLFFIFIGGFLAFGALNVYMDRYLMVLFPVFAVVFATVLGRLRIEKNLDKWAVSFHPQPPPAGDKLRLAESFGKQNFSLKTGIGISLIITSLFFFSQEEFRFDVDINYRDYVAVQEEASTYLEKQVPPQEAFLANFPLFNGFQDPRFGFARDTLHNTAWVVPHDSMKYRALLVPPAFANDLPKEGELLKVFQQGFTKVEIYVKE